MEGIPPQALQFAGSLVAILVLAWLVRRLGLGASPRLDSDADAAAAANEVSDGFSAATVARDFDGAAAVVRDHDGRIMVLKQHGVHFAGRILTSQAKAAQDGRQLIIDTGEERFGAVSLQVDNAATWVEAIDALDRRSDA